MGDQVAPRRTRQWVLAALLVVLAAVVGYQVLGGSATGGVASSIPAARPGRADAGRAVAPPDVRLEALSAASPEAPSPARNPFRFQPRPAVRPEPAAGAARAAPAGPRPAAAAPRTTASAGRPFALKFIGTVKAPGAGLIAALSDGTFVYHGREGDVIDGRYRIVTIGMESIVLEDVTGGGRQTIRLTG